MSGHTLREVSGLLDLPEARIRGFVRRGFVAPHQNAGGELEFSFQDLVLLRTAKGLLDTGLPLRRIGAALDRLRAQLPDGAPLSGVRVSAQGGDLVVTDGDARWNPESGQVLFDFDVGELARAVEPLERPGSQRAADEAAALELELSVEDWYELGADLESQSDGEARDAYRRALELDPCHAGAHVRLGRLLHQSGLLTSAEAHYRLAVAYEPALAVAAFDLGVVLEQTGRAEEAVDAYERAIGSDPAHREAHRALARLYELRGDRAGALRSLRRLDDLED